MQGAQWQYPQEIATLQKPDDVNNSIENALARARKANLFNLTGHSRARSNTDLIAAFAAAPPRIPRLGEDARQCNSSP